MSHQMYYRDSTDEDEEIDKAKEVTNTSREQATEVRDKIFFRKGGGRRKAGTMRERLPKNDNMCIYTCIVCVARF